MPDFLSKNFPFPSLLALAGASGPAVGSPQQLMQHLLPLAETEQLCWRLQVGK